MEENKELKEFKEGITAEEAESIRQRREYIKDFIDDNRFKTLAVLSDQTYDGFLERVSLAKINLNFVMIYKRNIDQNKIDLLKGSTERKAVNGKPLEMKELEIENLNAEINLSNYVAKLRRSLRDLFKYVNLKKLDGSEIINQNDLFVFIDKMEADLNKVSLSLYREKAI